MPLENSPIRQCILSVSLFLIFLLSKFDLMMLCNFRQRVGRGMFSNVIPRRLGVSMLFHEAKGT